MTVAAVGLSRPDRWSRLGKRPGPVMYALDFMRVERVPHGRSGWRWRAWDVLRVPEIRPTNPTTIHRTLRAAKGHCESIVRSGA